MKLQFFSREFTTRLQQNAAINLPKYGTGTHWLEQLAAGKTHVYASSFVVEPPPALIESADASHDAENARRVYSWLRHLTPTVAMELRLWAYLTHCVFSDYMHARWPAQTESLIQRRYLFEGNSFASLSRNGIARLWWGAYLTRDEQRPNPFELTDVLFLRQDIQVSLLERAIGKCRAVRTAVLEYIRDNVTELSEKSFSVRIQVFARELNLLGGVAVLDAVPPSELGSLLRQIGKNVKQDTKAAAHG
jgi:hypothetical protein